MKPMQGGYVSRCGLTLLYPALKNFFGQEIGPGCAGFYKVKGTTLSMGYEYGAYPGEAAKSIDINIFPVGLDRFLDQTTHPHSSTLAPTENGLRLRPDAGLGNACRNLVRTEVTPISGSNWHGWIAEEIYSRSRSRQGRCKFFSPTYRCVSLVIGNAKMSAEFGGACLLKKSTTNLEEGLSYSLFLQMINSIHFNEE
ncbi:hypothetical protein PQR75_35660 [Paraburkholderia fungorum]|uniref:hypothetical protein n=1 Tax=Paraburkholderia fungorum TaxID=134537 RepID=UPI0038B8FB5F